MKMKTCMVNRELSWLAFNERVLLEAGNPQVPLGERLSYVKIYQNNLDEFFMVRVGTLITQMQSAEKIKEHKVGMSSKEQVKAIIDRVKQLEKKKKAIVEQLFGELETVGVRMADFSVLSQKEKKLLEIYFEKQMKPYLFPMELHKHQVFPFLENKELYVVLFMEGSQGKSVLGILPCRSTVFPRILELPTRPGNYVRSEDLLVQFAKKLFPKQQLRKSFLIRVTRNADMDAQEVYDEDLDYRDLMEKLLQRRKRLSPVRLEVVGEVKEKQKKAFAQQLKISKFQIMKMETSLDYAYMDLLQNLLKEKKDNKSLFYKKHKPYIKDMEDSMLQKIEEKDVLLCYPFESMLPFLKMLQEASVAEDVEEICITLYRVADKSKVVDALIQAAENGKKVVVLVELRARFDEANNIEMSRKLEEAGCEVLYGLGKYKVHSKICQIKRKKEKGSFAYITQIGTGNYNEKTATCYTDLSLLTADQEIGKEVARLFSCLFKGENLKKTKHLLVAPEGMRNGLLQRIEVEIAKAQNGRAGYIGLKMNSLTDKSVMKKLIEASRAGVKIELIVRGICCLLPGIKGMTENITVVSIVGRFLEHSRIYMFGQEQEDEMYISSADIMTRNMERRVEVAAPIYDPDHKQRIRKLFQIYMADNVKARRLNEKGEYVRVERQGTEELINAQEFFLNMVENAKKAGE